MFYLVCDGPLTNLQSQNACNLREKSVENAEEAMRGCTAWYTPLTLKGEGLMKNIGASVFGVLMLCAAAAGQSKGGDEAALKAIEAKWDAATLKGDATALGSIIADTYIQTTSEGKVRGRAETLAQLKSGEIKYQSAMADDLKIQVFGDAAVVNGRWRGKYVEKGKQMDVTERFTDTFIRQNGQWRCVATHSTTIK